MSGLELRSNPDIYICQGARGIDIYVRGAYLCCVKFRVDTSVRVSLKVYILEYKHICQGVLPCVRVSAYYRSVYYRNCSKTIMRTHHHVSASKYKRE